MAKDLSKEELILHTAMQVFIDKGYHGAKMQEIADRADINKALLHYYFRSKEKLYEHIFEHLIWNYINDMLKLLNTNLPTIEFIRTFVNNYIEFLRKNPKVPMFLLRELGEGGKTAKKVLKKLLAGGNFSITKFITLLKQGMDNGEIVKSDPVQLVITLLGSCIFFFIGEPIVMTLLPERENYDREAFIEERKDAIFKTIVYGLSPRGAEQ